VNPELGLVPKEISVFNPFPIFPPLTNDFGAGANLNLDLSHVDLRIGKMTGSPHAEEGLTTGEKEMNEVSQKAADIK
jgi:hypothetical protein